MQNVIQTSFHSGEWAPALNARVDLAKYHSAAAIMRNFFVDYRGGASTRSGTKFVYRCVSNGSRLIPFQASFSVNYVIEFGGLYLRFYYQGSPIFDLQKGITNITQANPAVVTSVAHGLSNNQEIYITSVFGMTQVNNRYFMVTVTGPDTFVIRNLITGANLDSGAYGAYTGGGQWQRVYTVTSPYAVSELPLVKYTQNVNRMVLTHPNHPAYELIINSAASWTLQQITFGSTATIPGGIGAATTLAAGSVNYAYVVTSVDANGQESAPSAYAVLAAKQDLRTTAGTNTISWATAANATYYNVYKAELSYAGAIPVGASFGYIGFTKATSFVDSNIPPNFSVTPPIAQNPFTGAGGLQSLTVTAGGSYTTTPTVAIAPPGAGVTATAFPTLNATAIALSGGGFGYAPGDVVTLPFGATMLVLTTAPALGNITSAGVISLGGSTTTVPSNPVAQISTTGVGWGSTWTMTWTVTSLTLTNPGSGYGAPPVITFNPAGATATATVGASAIGNPTVGQFFQQRLYLMAPPQAPQTFFGSQPGAPYNYNVSNPTQADDAITSSLVAGKLHEIKSAVAMSSGLIILTSQGVWQITGGAPGTAVTPIDNVANANSNNGASDLPPILAGFDIIYVNSKGSNVRDVAYDFDRNVYRGTDISVLSSHLFFGYTITDWAWAEEPFKLVWAVRNDGVMLSMTFLKEQELIGWARHDTDGQFKSVASVTEQTVNGAVDAVYVIAQRLVSGVGYVQFIERMADRYVSNLASVWCVDSGLQYSGSPATSFTGAEHLAGATIVGLADGTPITPFVMPATGFFTLPVAASTVIIGRQFTPQLQTLPLDIGEPTVQGKRKRIVGVSVRCQQTLGLSIGGDDSTLVPMKDLIINNLGSQTNELVTNLVTGDAKTIIDPRWSVQGQYLIQQNQPYPATVLGVIPDIVIGDQPK